MVGLLFGLRLKKEGETSSLLLSTMCESKWALGLVLTFLFVIELLLPVRALAQSIAESGFIFTGSHRPIQAPFFREFMSGGGVKVGPVRLHPFLGIAEAYTDNVFKTNTNRRSDYLTTIAPGLQAFLPFGGGQHSVLLDYRAGQFLYKNFTENNALAQDALGHVSLNFPSGLQIDFQGGRIDGFDPRGSPEDIQTIDITKWRIMSFMAQAEYSGSKAGIRFRALYADWHFKNNDQAPRRDRTSARAELTLMAKVTPSTSALLGFQIANNDYDKNKQLDSFSYGVFSGFRLAPSRKLSGELNIGFTVLNFDRAPLEQPPASGLSAGGKQQQFLFMRGNLVWNPTSQLSINVSPFRQIRQAGFVGSNTFLQTGVNISGRQKLAERVALRGIFTYVNSDFDTNRNDDNFAWRIGLEYRTVKWLGFRLDYQFDKRNSNEDLAKFYSNTVMLSIQGFL